MQGSLGLWIPHCGFRIPKPRIPDYTSKISRSLECVLPFMGRPTGYRSMSKVPCVAQKGREKWEMECAITRMGREKGNIDFQLIFRKATSLLDCETPYLITVG